MPFWLKSLWVRWNRIGLDQLHILLGRQAGAGGSRPVLTSDVGAVSSSIRKVRERRRRWLRSDQHPDGSVLERIARLERVVEQIMAISVPQILKDSAIMPQHAPAERVQVSVVEQIVDGVQAVPQERDQPGDQACRFS